MRHGHGTTPAHATLAVLLYRNDLMPELATPTIPSAERDLQRAALRALVELCERCAAQEQQIEQEHAATLEATNKELDRNSWGIEERFKNQQDAIRQKYEGRIEAAESRYKTDFDALKHSDNIARQRLDHEKNSIDREVKKGFEQAAWLAESVFDAAQIGVTEEFKKVNDRIAEEIKTLDEMEHAAAGLMLLYRQKPPPDEELRAAEVVPANLGAAPADATVPSPDTLQEGAGEGAAAASAAGGETLQSFYTAQHQHAEQL